MIFMGNDYSEGAAPQILEALVRTNMEQTEGYGTDEHCMHAAWEGTMWISTSS